MREIVERLLSIEREMEKRKKADALAAYNVGEKVHQKQLDFHKCLKRNRWVFGGNRSGKTECGAVECVYLARGIHRAGWFRCRRRYSATWHKRKFCTTCVRTG